MRNSKLTLMLAGLGLMLTSGCFITTESDRFTDTEEASGSPSGGGGSGDCPVGAPGCACTGSGACDTGLECVDMLNICVVPTDCDVGSPGCECTQGGTCDPGLLCADVEPAPGICVSDNPCLDALIGTESCQCTMGGGCDDGLTCLSGLCVDVPEPEGTSTGEDSDTTTGEADSSSSGAADSSSSGGGADTSGGASPTSGG